MRHCRSGLKGETMSSTELQAVHDAPTASNGKSLAQTTVVASIEPTLLKTESANSDRFVYSNYFVPLSLGLQDTDGMVTIPLVTYSQRVLLLPYFALAPSVVDLAIRR